MLRISTIWRRTLLAKAMLLMLFVSAAFTASSARAVTFSVSGTRIYKDGVVFTPKGANINGSPWVWNYGSPNDAIKFQSHWNFNTARINLFIYPERSSSPIYYQDLDAIVNAYTSRGIVVMIEAHDWTGGYPNDADLNGLKNWWYNMAIKHRNNPYVWFNVYNEPGPLQARWLTVHQEVIKSIRDQASANNIIVCDGASWGQESNTWDGNPVPSQNSAILTYGNQVKNFNNKTYQNIIFSMHMYDQWTYGDNKLNDYITRVQNAGHALIIGEVGCYPADNATIGFGKAVNTAMNVAPGKGVGILWWHYQPGDGFALTTQGGGEAVNSSTNPTNLTWGGQKMWSYSHSNTSPSGNLLSNPGFEANGASQTPSGWTEYSGWGTANAGYSEGGGRSGSYRGAHWASYSYNIATYQYRTGLANGNYTLRAWVKGSGGQTKAVLYAKNYGGSERNVTIPATGTWTQISLTNINVTNGQCEVGFYSESIANKWINFDDVEFFKQ